MRRFNEMPRPKASSRTINTEPKLPFVTPVVTFLIAGLMKVLPEPTLDVGAWGFALLVGFAAVGFWLCSIRRRSVLWPTEPGSSEATVKQSIATLRVLVSIVMVIVPVAILATSHKVLGIVPTSVAQYLDKLDPNKLDPNGFNGAKFSVRLDAEKTRNALLYASIEPAAYGFHQANSPWAFGDLYVLKTDRVVAAIVDGALPGFHVLATLALVLAALFVAVIFFMENLFDLLRHPKRRKKS